MKFDSFRPEVPWLDWAVRLQALSQTGLAYSTDPFDSERYAAIRDIAADIMATHSGLERTVVDDLFCGETGYQTPKMDSRGVVFKENKILLVREKSDGLWSIPGGFVDIDQTLRSNTEKEVAEESGYEVTANRLLLIQDHRFSGAPRALSIYRFFISCELIGGAFKQNNETGASDFFALDQLPPLSERRTTREQIALCHEAYLNASTPVRFL